MCQSPTVLYHGTCLLPVLLVRRGVVVTFVVGIRQLDTLLVISSDVGHPPGAVSRKNRLRHPPIFDTILVESKNVEGIFFPCESRYENAGSG